MHELLFNFEPPYGNITFAFHNFQVFDICIRLLQTSYNADLAMCHNLSSLNLLKQKKSGSFKKCKSTEHVDVRKLRLTFCLTKLKILHSPLKVAIW